MAAMLDQSLTAQLPWRESAERASRRRSAITLAGALLGLLVGGVGGRLAMMLLARLNPEATGVTSDDGFRIGQFTVGATLQLLLTGTVFGLVGACVYALVRHLMVGPRWFQVAAIAIGPAVVVGAEIVHGDGVDFRLLKPTWLAIALFLAIPALYAALLTLVAEHWIREDSWAGRAPLPIAAIPLLFLIPLAPLLAVMVALWALGEALRRDARFRTGLGHPALPWVARLGLVAVFAFALADLIGDVTELEDGLHR
ncbi:MAG: hypothetical protein ABJA93_08350 [Sporichthyaceae bacterium]